MNLNTLESELTKWEHHEKFSPPTNLPEPVPVRPTAAERLFEAISRRSGEKVVGGQIRWKPVDKQAAMLLAKAPWWAQPPAATTQPPQTKTKRKKKERKHMKDGIALGKHEKEGIGYIPNQSFVSTKGLTVTMINGVEHFQVEQVQQLIIQECEKMAAETRPIVRSAQDARRIVDELVRGLSGDFAQFKLTTKQYLEDIRQTRYAVVTETSQMTKPLSEVRQFFLGSDYKEQITRLREFVELCERLQQLKASGFLDSVADTMLRLA